MLIIRQPVRQPFSATYFIEPLRRRDIRHGQHRFSQPLLWRAEDAGLENLRIRLHCDLDLMAAHILAAAQDHIVLSADCWFRTGDLGVLEDRYLAIGHVAVSNRPSRLVFKKHLLLERGRNRKIRSRCQDYQTTRDIVARADVLLTLPRPLATHLDMTGIRHIGLPERLPELEACVCRHEIWGQDPPAIWLRKKIVDSPGQISNAAADG